MPGVNPLLIRSTSDLLYNYALSSMYRSQWVYDPDFALAKDPDIWEVVRRDPVIMSAMDRRERAIVRECHVEPPHGVKDKQSKLKAGICQDALDQIVNLGQARHRLARGPILGRTYEYVEGERSFVSLGGLPDMEWWVPTRLRHVDRRRFHIVPDWKLGANGQQTLDFHLEMYSVVRNRWEPVAQPEYFVQYVHDDTEDRVGYGRSLLEATYFYHYMKTVTMEKIAQGIDRWANGIVVGEIDGLRNASTSKTNEDLKKGMKSLLQNARSEHIVVVEKGDKIEVVETSGAGHEISMQFIRYLDEGIERLYNGSILPAGHAADAGSKARADVEADTSESFYQQDREVLDEILTRQLIGLFLRMNQVQLARLGLGEAKNPKLESVQQRREDPAQAMDVAEKVKRLGLPLIRSEVYHKSGYTEPSPDDEVLEGGGMEMPGEFGFNGNGDEEGEDGDGKPNVMEPARAKPTPGQVA